jgi:GT2 family glycosyltransferase
VAIASLKGGVLLSQCLDALERQTDQDFEIIVVDNSGSGLVERELSSRVKVRSSLRVHSSESNLGFAAAMNLAWGISEARYLATLNDDAEPHPGWLAALRREMESSTSIGMCASQVRLKGTRLLDSAGMLMGLDGTSKQRGHRAPVDAFPLRETVLFPSASAALYRREMLEDIGLFDADFFLYCEDTDLGLRARWNGWECAYIPDAIVEHYYSQSSSAASPLKAWHIERNRLWVAAKNFPLPMLLMVPLHSAVRYFWHLIYLLQNCGTAAQFRGEGHGAAMLIGIVLRAHWSLVTNFGELLRKRRAIQKGALLTGRQFASVVKRNSISGREIAKL